MELARPLALTQAGTPKMRDEEIVRRSQPQVNLYDRKKKTDFKKGTALVTTQRLLWIDQARRTPMYWDLSMVTHTEAHARFFASHAKIDVHFKAPGDAYIRLSFQEGGKTEMHEQLTSALQKKSWVVKKEERKQPEAFSTRSAGIKGLLAREQNKQRRAQTLTQAAFADLEALAANAKKVVAIAERYAQQRKAASGEGKDAGDANSFGNILQNAGIVNPVTKQGAGNLYHEELARQIAHFLRAPLEHHGDMLLLTDIYCMYNRARGTDLVSPDDVLAACRELERLRLGMKLRRFNTGVLVVQSSNHNPDAVVARLLRLLQTRAFIDGTFVATAWKVSLPVAQEHLQAAELSGALCRDDSLQGLRFYKNRFNEL